MAQERTRARVFGEVADLYDEHRPGYPAALYDAVLAAVPGAARALEAGAGTGKATLALAQRGLAVVALEPDPAMAACARRSCGEHPTVTVIEREFERWDGDPEAFDLVVSAQAWHWIDQRSGLPIAARALRPGGALAAWWNTPGENAGSAWDAVQEAYDRVAPELTGEVPTRPYAHAFDHDAVRAAGFASPRELHYDWSLTYDAASYAGLLQTHSNHRLLAPARRRRLLDAVESAIERVGGGRLEYRYRTRLLQSNVADLGAGVGS